jgi:hypothetical protein
MSPNAQYELALKLPIDRLKAILQGRPDVIDQSAALLALKQKMQMKTALDGQAAQAQLAQPSIKQQLLASSGVEALPALNMEIPDGGIAGEEEPAEMMAAGGAVQRFNGEFDSYVESPVRTTAFTPWSEIERRVREGDPAAIQYARQRIAKGPGIIGISPPQSLIDYLGVKSDIYKTRPIKGVESPFKEEPRSTAAKVAAAAPSVIPTATQDERELRRAATLVSRKESERKAPAPRRGIEQIVRSDASYNPEQQTTGPTALAALAGEPTAAKPAAPTDEFSGIGDYIKALQSYTQPEREALERAIAGRREKVEGEKAQRKGEFGGLAALGAAAELLKSGRPGATSIGEAFGSVGRAGAEYTKEERRIADQLDAADIEATKARLAMKQGDVQLGATLMGKSQDRAIAAADLAWKKTYQAKLLELQGVEQDEKKRHNMASEAADAERNRILAPYYSSLGAAALQRGGDTELQQSKRRLDAYEAVLKLPAAKMLEYKRMYPGKSEQEIQEILVNRMLGQAPAVGAPSAIPNLDAFSVREKTGRQ